MTNYTKATNFAAKDSLASGNAAKVVKGTEIDTEFTNIETAVNSKSDSANPVFTGVAEFADGSASAPSITNTADTNTGMFFPAADTIAFAEGGTETMRLDSSGNMGLGVTPSAWGTSGLVARALQLGGNAALWTRTDLTASMYLSANMYALSDGSFKYLATDYSTVYQQYQGQHRWFYAPSGTAGNAITFTQAMTLDASGNLGVGATSPAAKLDVAAGSSSTFAKFSSSNADPYFRIQNTSAGGKDWIIYSSGTGSSLPGTFRLFNNTDNLTAFTVDSSGNFLVGTTSATSHSFWKSISNDYAFNIRNTQATAPYGLDIYYSAASPNNTTSSFLYCEDQGGTQRASIRSNGGLYNYSANNSNLSDVREKKNISLAGDYLAKICSIPVKTFLYNDQTDEDLNLGVIAQDVQAVAPELVTESNWGSEEEPKMRLSIYQTDLQYALMKSIQELKAIVDAQAAEIAALKG